MLKDIKHNKSSKLFIRSRPAAKIVPRQKGQTTVEYMLLLAVVVAIVLVAFARLLPKARSSSSVFFGQASQGIMGAPTPCGDVTCNVIIENCETCPVDCGICP